MPAAALFIAGTVVSLSCVLVRALAAPAIGCRAPEPTTNDSSFLVSTPNGSLAGEPPWHRRIAVRLRSVRAENHAGWPSAGTVTTGCPVAALIRTTAAPPASVTSTDQIGCQRSEAKAPGTLFRPAAAWPACRMAATSAQDDSLAIECSVAKSIARCAMPTAARLLTMRPGLTGSGTRPGGANQTFFATGTTSAASTL